jgi:hypothetical protein
MSPNPDSIKVQSSSSDDDENQSKFRPVVSCTDADESDNGNNKKSIKSRRFQKTRKPNSLSSLQKTDNNHEQRHSSSNDDDEHKESNVIYNGYNNERRTKAILIKKSTYSVTTTTDDDTTKHIHRYHPLDNLQSKLSTTTTNESNLSSPIPITPTSNNQPSIKKINRFQIKSIRKSQQQQILLANAIAAKSSNEDDCSVPNNKLNLQLKPSIIERQHTVTPTTDGEYPITNTDNSLSTLNTVENEHHRVRFHVKLPEKKESVVEEEKLPNQTTTVTLPTPVPPSSNASAQGEVSYN